MTRQNLTSWFIVISMALSLGCSVGALAVQAPTRTPTPLKTSRPTYTSTPHRTATFTPSPTPTSTLTPTPTSTSTPTFTPTPSAKKPAKAAPAEPAQPAAPAPTDTPAPPAATPTPAFPFQVNYFTHNTGSAGETRMTAWIRVDYGPGLFKSLAGFQMKALAPDGQTYLSEMSGSGFGDSTVRGTGDNHNMNTKLEFKPYTPGVYKIALFEGGSQVSSEIEVTLSADPRQYIHFDFFKQEKQN